MIERGDSLAVGVSGGADSVCLLRILYDLSEQMDFTLAAVHVEHGIRGEESRRDASFTEKLCADLGIPFLLFCVEAPERARRTGRGLEETARELRYDCFMKACGQIGANRVAVAHHAGDSAETMLFHLARGTGIRGLCGIRPVTEFALPGCGAEETGSGGRTPGDGEGCPVTDAQRKNQETGLRIIRPLLCVTHEEIVSWLDGLRQPYCTDSTNADPAYSRNRIRERVLPELGEINPRAIPHMRRTAGQLEEICGYLDEAARQAGRGAYAVAEREDGFRSVELFCDAFETIHPFLRKHLLHLLLCAQGGGKDLTSLHVERVLDLMDAGVGKRVSLPRGITAERLYESIVLYTGDVAGVLSGETAENVPAARDLRIPGETIGADGLRIRAEILDFPEISQKIPEKRYTKWFDYDKIKSVVQLRGRKTGDYFQTDAAGGHKKLNRYLIDEKVPLCERDRLSLLADGDHVLWVVGYRISEAYKVTGGTRRVLCVTAMERE